MKCDFPLPMFPSTNTVKFVFSILGLNRVKYPHVKIFYNFQLGGFLRLAPGPPVDHAFSPSPDHRRCGPGAASQPGARDGDCGEWPGARSHRRRHPPHL
jgi:hypothetical protein